MCSCSDTNIDLMISWRGTHFEFVAVVRLIKLVLSILGQILVHLSISSAIF